MNLLIPSLKITGGNIEAIKLADGLTALNNQKNNRKYIYALWRCRGGIQISDKKINYLSKFYANKLIAPFQLIYLLIKFYLINIFADNNWIFTHYSTLIFSLLLKKNKRYFFVQDLEWKFIKNSFFRLFLKKFIIYIYSRGNILAANDYLESALIKNGLKIYCNINIWADYNFLQPEEITFRSVDAVMVLRNGHYKRLDLYMDFISKCANNNLTLAIITTEIKIFNDLKNSVKFCYLCPTLQDMREIYSNSKIFIHLSDHEGFGLPPLEAMGSGCVPLCRDSGGVTAYMANFKGDGLLLPASYDIEQIFTVFKGKLIDSVNLSRLSKKAVNIFTSGFTRENYEVFKNTMNGNA